MQRQSLASIAGMTTANLPYANIGKVDNSGVDMSLDYNRVVSSDFLYSIRARSHTHNKIVFRDEPNYSTRTSIFHRSAIPWTRLGY